MSRSTNRERSAVAPSTYRSSPRSGAAASVTSLMYLVPPTTALVAWVLFSEPVTAVTLAGTALTAFGVALVVRAPKAA